MIRLTFLGTKAEVEIPQEGHDDPQCQEARKLGDGYYHRLHSSLLVEAEGKRLMLDAGEGHEETVARVKPDAILVTHAHPDHLSRRLGGLEPAVPVYMSEDTAEVVRLPNEQVFARDKPFEVAGFKVVAHPVVHSLVAPAVCFKVSKGSFTLVYAPDVLSIPDREDFLKGVDLYIGDGSSLTRDIIRKKDDKLIGHASMLRQLRWAEGAKQVLFTHVGHLKKTEADVNQALRIASDGKARLAQDGMSLDFESLQARPELAEGVTTEAIAPVLAPAFPGRAEPQSLIQDAEHYDASAARDDQLRDDWRIVCGWYATLKSGGEIKFNEATILALGEKILMELLRRKRKDPSVFTARPQEMKAHPRELYERVTREWDPEDRAFLETEPEDLGVEEAEDEGAIEELVRQPFGSPGGKTHLVDRILPLIPEHEAYIEPFVGGGAIFFAKEPSKLGVINDIDERIAFLYRFIRDMSQADLARLKRFDWKCSRELGDRLKELKPEDDVEKFHRLFMLKRMGFESDFADVRGYNTGSFGREVDISKLPEVQKRLKGVKIHARDYREVLDQYDSPTSFFYLDPPYPGRTALHEFQWTEEDVDALVERLKKLKGKFILSMSSDMRDKFPSQWEIIQVRPRRNPIFNVPDRKRREAELLVLNFKPGKLEAGEVEAEGTIEELVRQPFGSPGGKLWIAPKIASLIPEHRVYVEPFAGAAAVFWAKEPSEVEALGDIDPEVMFAYRFIQRASDEDIARLRRYDWRHQRELFEQLKGEKPKDDVERFRRFLYLRKASYGSRGVNFMVDKKERVISLDSFERWQERLKGVHLHTGSYEELLDKYDSQDACFYLDPPYPGHWQGEGHGFTQEQWDRLLERLKKLKGKFILSLFRDLVETLPSGWHTRRVKTRRALGQDNVGRVLYHYEYLAANFKFGTGTLEDETGESLARIGHQPFGSQAGKTRLAPRIVKMISPHKTYVEPFAGGAAVFWATEPAEKEVLNDKDPEIAFAYRFIKGLTEEQLRRLRRYDWRRTKPLFQKLKESKPSDDVERFRKFYYLAKASFGESRQTFGNEGSDIDVEKLPAASERLKNVTILGQDFEPVVQRYDSADTFFYLDPPYPGRSFKGEFQFNLEDLERLVKVLKGIKGRFILSLGAEHRKYLPASWWTKKVLVRRMLWLPQIDKRLPPNYELLAANFTPSRESLEALEAELEEEALDQEAEFPEIQDFMVVPDFISLVGSAVTGEAPEDLDILVRSAVRSESLEVAIRKQLDPEKQGYLHFIYEPAGPHDDYIPLWDLVALRKPEIEVVEVGLRRDGALTPGKPFTPLKTAGGYGELEFSVEAADKLWETWGQGYADVGLIVQEKFDGYRLTLHRKGDRVFAFSEDAKRDVVDDLPSVEEDLQALADGDFILDSELLLYAEEAVTLNNTYKPGDKIERMDMASFLGKDPAGKFRAVCQVFDCLYLDGEDLHQRLQTERLEALHKLLNPVDTLHLKEVESRLVHTREEFLKAVRRAASRPHSEGAMVKVADSDYPLTGRSSKIAKLKNFKEIRGRVVEKRKTEAGAYVYDIALSDGSVIGSTYATKLEADIGDILEVRAAEVKVKEEDGRKVFTWDNPIVASLKPRGTALTTPEQAEAMARKRRGMAVEDEGETRSEAAEKFWAESWHKSFPPTGKGEFVYHHHWRGLSEDETKLSEEELLKAEHSVHGDLRFQFSDEALFGFTVFLGTTEEVRKSGGDRLMNLPPDDKLQGAWKLSQPVAWLKVAREKPLVTAPGEVGATSDKYSKFLAEDWGAYQIGVWREHFFELFLDGRKLKGRYTIQYAPVDGKKVWLIGKPKDQTPYAEANKLDDVVKELKDKGQRYLVWAKPGEKPELIEVGKAEQLVCPKCGDTLKPEATRLAKLSNDFHDVFRCPGCKHIFSPLDKEESRLSAASPLG